MVLNSIWVEANDLTRILLVIAELSHCCRADTPRYNELKLNTECSSAQISVLKARYTEHGAVNGLAI